MKSKNESWSWGKAFCFFGLIPACGIPFAFVRNFSHWQLFFILLGVCVPVFVIVDLLYPGFSVLKNLFAKPETEDPLNELRDYMDDLEEKCIELNGNISKLRSQATRVRRTIKQNAKEMEILSLKVDNARRTGNTKDEALALRQIGRLKSLNDKYGLMVDRLDDMLTMMGRIHEYTSYKLADTKNEFRMREQEYRAISSGYSAMMNAHDIMDGGQDSTGYDTANEKLQEELHAKIAEMETFMELSQPLFDDMEMHATANRLEGEKIYNRIMKEGNALLTRINGSGL